MQFELNKEMKQEHKIYKAQKEAILREKAILERAHMKLVSLHKDAIKAHSRKDTNVKIILDPVINDLSKEEDNYNEDKSDRKETNDFLATLVSGFLEASSRHLPSIDPRPRPRSPKYETLLKYTFYFYFFIIVCHNPNINFFLKKKTNSNGKLYVRFM